MRATALPALFACLVFLLAPALAAEEAPPPDKPPAQPDKGPNFEKIWSEVIKVLQKGKYSEKEAAAERLISFPLARGLAPVLAKAIMACKGYHELQVKLARRLTTFTDDAEAREWVFKVATAEAMQRKNASSELLGLYLRFLFEAGMKEEGLKMAEGALPQLEKPGFVFAALFDQGEKELIDVVGRFAVNRKNPPILRREAVEYLGRWWAGPPCFAARVPALIEAMEVRETAQEAQRALWKICLPTHQSSKRWRRWWEGMEDIADKDADIIWRSFEDAYVRVSGSAKKKDGARRISEYIEPWNNEHFRWALPLLHRALLEFEDKELMGNLLYTLGKIGDPSSLDAVMKLRELPRASTPDSMRQLAKALGSLAPEKSEQAGEALRKMFDSSMSLAVKREIIQSWGRIRYDTDETVSLLVDVMKKRTGAPRMTWAAAEALGEMKALKALPDMVQTFQATDDSDLKLHLLRAFRKMKVKTPEVRSIAIVSLESSDFRHQEAALELLSDIQDEKAIPNIKRAFENTKNRHKTRLLALDALKSFPTEKVFDTFVQALRTRVKSQHARNDPLVNLAHVLNDYNQKAVDFFEKDGGANLVPEMLDSLLDMLKDRKSAGRLKAVGYVGHPRVFQDTAISVLISLLHPTEDDQIVQEAVKILIAHPSKDNFGTLVKRLSGGHPKYAWIDYQIAYVLRSYVQQSSLANPENPLESFDGGTDKRAWLGWWSRSRGRMQFGTKGKKG